MRSIVVILDSMTNVRTSIYGRYTVVVWSYVYLFRTLSGGRCYSITFAPKTFELRFQKEHGASVTFVPASDQSPDMGISGHARGGK